MTSDDFGDLVWETREFYEILRNQMTCTLHYVGRNPLPAENGGNVAIVYRLSTILFGALEFLNH